MELIYFNGCPNVDLARKNIKKALEDTGWKAQWDEWEHNNSKAPSYVQQYGSPTILVDGKDIAGGPGDCCAPNSCRIYADGGVPSVDMIKSAISAR